MAGADLVLVEGWKAAAIPKIEVHRPVLGLPLLHLSDPHIVALAADAPVATGLRCLPLDRPDLIADFILALRAPAAHAPDATPS
ncbi:MAG: molybdopterin-guanine dinucleotide biosynthesis protein B [bacterium]